MCKVLSQYFSSLQKTQIFFKILYWYWIIPVFWWYCSETLRVGSSVTRWSENIRKLDNHVSECLPSTLDRFDIKMVVQHKMEKIITQLTLKSLCDVDSHSHPFSSIHSFDICPPIFPQWPGGFMKSCYVPFLLSKFSNGNSRKNAWEITTLMIYWQGFLSAYLFSSFEKTHQHIAVKLGQLVSFSLLPDGPVCSTVTLSRNSLCFNSVSPPTPRSLFLSISCSLLFKDQQGKCVAKVTLHCNGWSLDLSYFHPLLECHGNREKTENKYENVTNMSLG